MLAITLCVRVALLLGSAISAFASNTAPDAPRPPTPSSATEFLDTLPAGQLLAPAAANKLLRLACADQGASVCARILELNAEISVDDGSFLHIACENCNAEAVEWLIATGANVNVVMPSGLTPLFIA